MIVAKYSPRAIILQASRKVLQYPNDDICMGTLDALLARAHERKLQDNQRVKVTVQVRCHATSHANHYCADLGGPHPSYRFPEENRTVSELKKLYKEMTGESFDYAGRQHQGAFISFDDVFGTIVTDTD